VILKSHMDKVQVLKIVYRSVWRTKVILDTINPCSIFNLAINVYDFSQASVCTKLLYLDLVSFFVMEQVRTEESSRYRALIGCISICRHTISHIFGTKVFWIYAGKRFLDEGWPCKLHRSVWIIVALCTLPIAITKSTIVTVWILIARKSRL